jgi:hypothetical protein
VPAEEISRVPAFTEVPPLYVLAPVKIRVPVPVLVSCCVPPIIPAMVNESAAFTATVASEFVPGPFNVSMLPFDPVSVRMRGVAEVFYVGIEELVETVNGAGGVALGVG